MNRLIIVHNGQIGLAELIRRRVKSEQADIRVNLLHFARDSELVCQELAVTHVIVMTRGDLDFVLREVWPVRMMKVIHIDELDIEGQELAGVIVNTWPFLSNAVLVSRALAINFCEG